MSEPSRHQANFAAEVQCRRCGVVRLATPREADHHMIRCYECGGWCDPTARALEIRAKQTAWGARHTVDGRRYE